MILSAVLNLFLVPVIYVMIVNLRERGKPRPLAPRQRTGIEHRNKQLRPTGRPRPAD